MIEREMVSKLELKQLSLKFIIGFPLVGCFWTLLVWYFGNSTEMNLKIAFWIGGIGWILGMVTILSYSTGCRILFFWKKLIVILDTIIVWTLLPLFYFSILTPFSLVLRLFGKSRMSGKRKNAETYWHKCKPAKPERYIRQF